MGLYAGIDLHSTSMYLGIIRKDYKPVYEKRLGNDIFALLEHLEPFRAELQGIAVESTYNWYWLVDGLMDHGYKQVHLANPCGMKQYEGLKHTDDRHDAFWLAKMLALEILPEGYIYPREDRPVRDLLRKRSFLVGERTRVLLNLRSMLERETSVRMKSKEIARLETEQISQILGEKYLELSAKASLRVVDALSESIKQIEKAVKARMRVRKPFQVLLTAPGIGDILAMTIMLEVGDIRRFEKVGDFSSYCRLVNTNHFSAGKRKGEPEERQSVSGMGIYGGSPYCETEKRQNKQLLSAKSGEDSSGRCRSLVGQQTRQGLLLYDARSGPVQGGGNVLMLWLER